ncbi:hypothetical protein ScPMuIL_016835 [Solemya velum]
MSNVAGMVSGMRVPFRSPDDLFDVQHLESTNPMSQFGEWFKQASETPGVEEPNAMSLATATKDGCPSVRMVLLKGFDENGFTFFTNYNSRKGQELAQNPVCALSFYWTPLKRQVRIEGCAEKISSAESEEYFHSRPRASQIGAIVSKQSSVIPNRGVLDDKYASLIEEFKDESKVIPMPEYWGGFLVRPKVIEFWQGQTNRVHDRIRFRRPRENGEEDPDCVHTGEGGWVFERLCP